MIGTSTRLRRAALRTASESDGGGSGSGGGALTTHLKVFADYNDFTEPGPVTNRAAGATRPAEFQAVGSDTPVLTEGVSGAGSAACQYTADCAHRLPMDPALDLAGNDFFAGVWYTKVNGQGFGDETTMLGHVGRNGTQTLGWRLRVGPYSQIPTVYHEDGDSYVREGRSVGNSPADSFPPIFAGMWYTQSDSTLHGIYQDGSQDSWTVSESVLPMGPPGGESENVFMVGGRFIYDSFDGEYNLFQSADPQQTIGQVIYEIAPPGELKWPEAALSGWVYNGGTGRTWEEIQSYTP